MRLFALLAVVSSATSFHALAATLEGTWQGPCETRGTRSVKFTYAFSALDEQGNGRLAKTKVYFDDAACGLYNHTGRQTVPVTVGAPSEEGVYPLDVLHRGTVFYDIFAFSEDGRTLSFGASDATDPALRPTELSTGDRVFVKVDP